MSVCKICVEWGHTDRADVRQNVNIADVCDTLINYKHSAFNMSCTFHALWLRKTERSAKRIHYFKQGSIEQPDTDSKLFLFSSSQCGSSNILEAAHKEKLRPGAVKLNLTRQTDEHVLFLSFAYKKKLCTAKWGTRTATFPWRILCL